MKHLSEVICCVVDYGSFLSVAEKLAETMQTVYYYSPFEAEFLGIDTCIKGTGLSKVIRLDDYLDPETIKEIDLFVFPDRGYGGVQRHLRDDLKKAVWGSMGVSDIEEYRTLFIDMLKERNMPLIKSVPLQGLNKLSDLLKKEKDKWVKIDRYRANMETWHHIDYKHSQRKLEEMARVFGPTQNLVRFVIQDVIETDVEIGYDGWCVDGTFPIESYQGYESKNESYLGAKLALSKLPEEVTYVNNKFAKMLKEAGYRNFWSTEIRVKDGVPYFIDPTSRMPGQTGEQLLETCSNLSEVIWQGANGVLIPPRFEYAFAAEATLHYKAGDAKDWKILELSKEVERWVKLYHYCKIDGMYQFAPHVSDELGVVIGVGNTVEKCIEHLKKNIELLKNEPVQTDITTFADLIKKIKVAEKAGIKFSKQPLPKPEIVL